jgi:PAS domain S-box-containing protein
MQHLTLDCLTRDPHFAAALRELPEARKLDFVIQVHDGESSEASFISDDRTRVLLVDAESYGTQLDELLSSYRGAGSIVVGGAAEEPVIGEAASMFGSEFLLKDPNYDVLALIPLVVRKILRHRDVDTTHEDLIRSSERRYEDLVQAIPDVVYKIDPEGYFVFVNESVRNLGYEPADLIGRHFSTVVAEEDLPRVSRRYVLPKLRGSHTGRAGSPGLFDERRTGERRTDSLEIRLKRRHDEAGGGIIASLTSYGEITATGHYLEDTRERHFTGTVGIIRDITQRRRSEERLTQLSLAIEQIAVGICITDRHGFVGYANPFFFRLNMLEPGRVLGANIRRLARRYLQEETFTEIRAALDAEEAWEDDRIVWKRSGESYWSWLKVYPVRNVDGVVAQYIIFQQDITDRKQNETDLRRALESQRQAVRSIHHRVRSGLETLSTLVTTMARAEGDHPITPERLIRFVAGFHEFAYEGNEPDQCDLGNFLEMSLSELLPVDSRRSRRFGLRSSLPQARLPVLHALPLVVAVGTVLATAVNRNFPRERRESIVVTGTLQESVLTVTIRHPGENPLGRRGSGRSQTGPAGDEEQLINATVSQVDGTFESHTVEGHTTHTVRVPAPGTAQPVNSSMMSM